MPFSRPSLRQLLNLLCYLYLVLLLFPQTVFPNKLAYKNFVIYYAGERNTKQIEKVINQSLFLLTRSELFDQNHKQKVFLCSSTLKFLLFSGPNNKALALNHPITQNIFVQKASVSQNRILRHKEGENPRTLSSIIVHETTHSLIDNHLGVLKSRFVLPKWKSEGYSEFIANESTYDNIQGFKKLCENQQDEKSQSYKYFLYRYITQQLFVKESLSFDTFSKRGYDLDSLVLALKKSKCKK